MFFAIVTVCYLSSGSAITDACASADLPESFRTLSDCLIEVEALDRKLKNMNSSIYRGVCTQEQPA